jgi:hypothetical protein
MHRTDVIPQFSISGFLAKKAGEHASIRRFCPQFSILVSQQESWGALRRATRKKVFLNDRVQTAFSGDNTFIANHLRGCTST